MFLTLSAVISYLLPSPPAKPAKPAPTTNMAAERTYIMIKPDGVQRGLVGVLPQPCSGAQERGGV